jgi:hypothetical protein
MVQREWGSAPAAGALSRLQIARSVPAGSRRTRSQKAWIREVLADPEVQGWRRDRRDHWEAIFRRMADYMDWSTRCSRPTWDRLAAAADPQRPLHKSTVARCLKWLRGRGYLGVAESGSTPEFRPMALRTAGDGNLAAVYVLTVHGRNLLKRTNPTRTDLDDTGQSVNATPSVSRRDSESPSTRERTREGAKFKGDKLKGQASPGLTLLPPGGRPPTAAGRPEKRSEGERLARLVQDVARDLRGLSPAHVLHLARAQLAAGWTPADVVYALDHQPGGRSWGFTATVRHPAGWARARLAVWLNPDGTPRSSASQVRAAAAARIRAEMAARRNQAAELEAARGDSARGAAAARVMLAAAGGKPAHYLARHQLLTAKET